MMSADPDPALRGDRFCLTGHKFDGRRARFSFRCDRFGTFVEEVDFGTEGEVPDALLGLLHVALGVSTYKAAAAKTVALPPLTPAGRAMAEALYTEGLAEFFVRSGLPYPPGTVFEGNTLDPKPGAAPSGGVPLVAFGGGKDSYVAGAIMREATGEDPQFTSVVLSDAVARTLDATAPSPLLFIRRKLDPGLMELEGAFGGHVPITAINILTMTIAGLLRGSGPIVFANERSADEPTMLAGGVPANHQYSKSSAFEALVREAVDEAAPEAPRTFSVLRPFSELWIAERFAKLKEPFGRFTSCNRNFRLAGDAEKRWCGACAKCAFTSLILSPFISGDEAQAIFGRAMLDLPALQPFYEELCGLSDQKPWDCVGTIDECQAALFLLSRDPRWKNTEAVRILMPRLLARRSEAELGAQVEEARAPGPRGDVPAPFYDAALRL